MDWNNLWTSDCVRGIWMAYIASHNCMYTMCTYHFVRWQKVIAKLVSVGGHCWTVYTQFVWIDWIRVVIYVTMHIHAAREINSYSSYFCIATLPYIPVRGYYFQFCIQVLPTFPSVAKLNFRILSQFYFYSCRKCHLVSFAFMFGYLMFFRMSDRFGFTVPPGHTNMVQMILTLKVLLVDDWELYSEPQWQLFSWLDWPSNEI